MSLLSGVSAFFGLDIGTTGIRLVELRGQGTTKALVKYAYVPVDAKLAQSDSRADQQKLAQIIANLVSEARLTTKNVAVGLPSSRVFTTVADMDRLPIGELGKALMYQADSLIPTPPAESKIDWALLGDSPKDKTKVEVLLSSVTNNFIEQRLDMIEGIGLNVIAFEPDGIALPRAVVPLGTTMPQLVIDMGNLSTDLVVTMGDAPRLVRSIPTGANAVVLAAQQNLGIDDKQAQQFVYKFGVSKDKLEGQVYQAVINTVDTLVNEVDKSIKFFQARYTESKLERIVVTGGASAIPEFPLYLANKFGINVEIGNAWRNVSFAADRQNELLAVSNQFSVAVGLAERNE
jgi:type IV pilus assembly protein PilM